MTYSPPDRLRRHFDFTSKRRPPSDGSKKSVYFAFSPEASVVIGSLGMEAEGTPTMVSRCNALYLLCDTFVATKVPEADGSLELRKSLSVNFGVTKP